MKRFLGMTRTAMLCAMFLNLGGCQANPERPDASAYGDPPHDYEQPAKDAVAAIKIPFTFSSMATRFMGWWAI